jgi:hypothetical protein
MAYLSDFDHDIFISFAHVDNQDRWVEVFLKHLEIELNRIDGRMGIVKIWFDKRRLQSNQLFDKTIEEALNRTALFVALNSNGYLHPDSYCHASSGYGLRLLRKTWRGNAANNDLPAKNIFALSSRARSVWSAAARRSFGRGVQQKRFVEKPWYYRRRMEFGISKIVSGVSLYQSGDKSPHSKRCRALFSAGRKITFLFCFARVCN